MKLFFVGIMLAALLPFATSFVQLRPSRILPSGARSNSPFFQSNLSPNQKHYEIPNLRVCLAFDSDGSLAADHDDNYNENSLNSNQDVHNVPIRTEKDINDELSVIDDFNIKTDDNTDIVHQKLEELKHKYQSQISQFRDSKIRYRMYKQVQTGFLSVFRHLVFNLRDGKFGSRGEGWFVAQIILVSSIFFGIHPLVRWMLSLFAIFSTMGGLYFLLHALSDLGELTTPFVYPVKSSVVVENGVYRLVRHPMYGGLLMMCAGVSILAGSVHKLLLTLILAWVLNNAADIEEKQLLHHHGEFYVSYMSDKKKFIPLIL
jgi:protein-S-isoprenylcysteine O-methyltransferase Ste14